MGGSDNDIGAANTDNANNDAFSGLFGINGRSIGDVLLARTVPSAVSLSIGRHRRIFASQKSAKQLKMDDLRVYTVPVLLIYGSMTQTEAWYTDGRSIGDVLSARTVPATVSLTIGRCRRIFAPQKSKKQLKMDDLQVSDGVGVLDSRKAETCIKFCLQWGWNLVSLPLF